MGLKFLFLIFAFFLMGCGTKEVPECINATELDECRNDLKVLNLSYTSLEFDNSKPIPSNCTVVRNVTVIQRNITMVNSSDSYVLRLIRHVRYLEGLNDNCYFVNQSDREVNLTDDLNECQDRLEDIEDLLE